MSRFSRLVEVAHAVRAMNRARDRERWPAERMRAHQAAALAALIRDAMERSPFHRSRLAGVIRDEGSVDLAALPTLDKATLMASFVDALCAPQLRGRDLRAHLLDPEPLFGDYRVMASSGSTGTPSLYVYSRADWVGIMAMFLRLNEMVGIRPHVPRLRLAAIGAPSLASMTQKSALTSDIGLHRVLRLSVRDPLSRLVDALNTFQPDAVNAYPSIAALLAEEQLVGRLRISPRLVSTSSELRTADMTERIERAFGVRPFDVYGTSEGLWGIDCEHHTGIHLFEDWCIVENVDSDGNPVPDGQPGERLLVTNLFNRTLPLIRFEISDVVAIERGLCACGRTLPRLQAVKGRLDDVLYMLGRDDERVAVHPTQFSVVTTAPGVREYQVVQRGQQIVLRLALGADASADTPQRVARAVTDRLESIGVTAPGVVVEAVPAIERTAAGKLKLIVKEQSATAAPHQVRS